MSKYKSPPHRLVRFFEESRNNWKQKALDRQERLRSADVKMRDLTKSRDKWKQETKESKRRIEQLEKELEKQRNEEEKKR
jgi:chromosome segregation ATPase